MVEAISPDTTQARFCIKAMSIIGIMSGILLIIGLWVQLAAIVASLTLIINVFLKIKNKKEFTGGYDLEIVLIVISLSLLLLGPGAFSIDLPL